MFRVLEALPKNFSHLKLQSITDKLAHALFFFSVFWVDLRFCLDKYIWVIWVSYFLSP